MAQFSVDSELKVTELTELQTSIIILLRLPKDMSI